MSEEKRRQKKKNAEKPAKAAKEPAKKPAIAPKWVITIERGAGKRHVLKLTPAMLRYGLSSIVALAVLLIASCGLSGYLLFSRQANFQTIEALQKANAVQQKQLVELAQKASQLQGQLDKLNGEENELKALSNLSVGTQKDPDAAAAAQAAQSSGGQGGPWIAPDYQNINAVFDDIEKRIKLHEKNLALIRQALLKQKKEGLIPAQKAVTTPTGWPARGTISSPYGFRWHGTDFHPGVDIAADYGTPIHATADGVVTAAGWNSGGYGNMVDIRHKSGLLTRYGHASSVVVHVGEHVKRGQIIAYVGSTGYSTGPHVHYEVRLNGRPIDPMPYL